MSVTGPAAIAFCASCAFAAWMIFEMLFLLFNRWAAERHELSERETDVAITRDMLAALNESGSDHAFDDFNTASRVQRLRAARRLIQLVRGDDRERLFAISENAHLFDETLSQLDSPIVVRRLESVRELELFGSPACVEGLKRCMARDKNAEVRLHAAVALANLDQAPDCQELMTMLDLGRGPLTKMHVGLFRQIAARDCAAIVALSEDEAFCDQRAMLVDALGWTENFNVLTTLERHGHDADPEVRCAALRAARRIGHPAASSWVASALLDPSEPVRIQAVQACGDLGLRDTVPILLSLAQNPSWWVRTRATEALDKLRLTPSRAPASIPVAAALPLMSAA